ncbi:MAG: hypothetical protein JST64_15345 [Actinobacteria bacterium]|nr:hypothetical protein [Actinomycetota bacterium]
MDPIQVDPVQVDPVQPVTRSDHPTVGGVEVLEWLRSSEARSVARGRLRSAGLLSSEDLVDDVLGDATVSVLRRLRGPEPLVLDSAAAYGATVVRNQIRALARGRDRLVEADEAAMVELHEAQEQATALDLDPWFEDDVRVVLEHLGGTATLLSAALALLTFIVHPGSEPAEAPTPRAGSRPDQARCWPALWLAGERSIFPDRRLGDAGDSAALRRRRARRIAQVQAQLERAYARMITTATTSGAHRG